MKTITCFLQIAPPCPRVEDLRYHWTQLSIVCQRCQHNEGQPPAIEETHVTRHLSQMLKALVAEEREQRVGGPLSPCMEYLVQEKVLAMLATHARADRPLGIRQHVYIFLVGVLNHLHHSHLHHTPIHKSLQPIALTGGISSGYTPEDSLPPTPSHEGTATTTSDSSSVVSTQKSLPKFPLVDALLNLCHSADSQISATAHDCLVGIASVREGQSSSTIARHTLLPHYLATRLVTASDSIPVDTEPALIEDIPLSERVRTDVNENSDSEDDEDVGEFPGRREVVTFLYWLTFCDKLVDVSDGALGSSICSTVREVFLDGVLRGNLTSDDEDTTSLFIALTAKIITSVSSPLLVNGIVSWLTEEAEDLDGGETSMRQQLMILCQQPPHHLQIQALRLLQVLMEKPGSMAVQSLVLNYMTARSYHDSSAAEHQQSSWSDEEDERYKHRDGETSPGSPAISRTLAPANINKIVKRFLTVVPEDLRSTTKDDFESYMADAQRQYRDVCRSCASFGWPREAVTPECPSDSSSTASRESRAEAEGNTFYEGPFLSMLMDFLEHLPDQDYDINLQVTSLVATLALLPHPHLHEFLLNPTITLSGGVRTPFTVLSSVVRDEDERKFEALIVIEEFTKELASIAYAKYITEGSGW
ncbi:protein FAM160B1-like [Homarus americanus]|uniref:Protein FAM160B1-like n=1 Tax=Homarus americanus TaxID=6706 RepID=A0A8J5N735_HOMAM|nr:protein FAM160B1-like [Homarus americanus]